ncbi:MAG: S8 family serine peptidase, partial [Planctomycetes bacterium]|nr:S8 family serine peptidase [Planctomycetota bacterium]
MAFLGPHALDSRDTTRFCLGLIDLNDPEGKEPDNDRYTWWVRCASTSDTVSMAYVDSIPGGVLRFSGCAVDPDTGKWEFYGKYGTEAGHLLGQFSFFSDVIHWRYRGWTQDMIDSLLAADVFEMTVMPGAVYLSSLQDSAAFSRSSAPDSSLYDVLQRVGTVQTICKVISDDSRAANLHLDNTYLVKLSTPSDNIVDTMAELCNCSSILGLHAHAAPGIGRTTSGGVPDDQVYDTSGLCCEYSVEKCDDWGNGVTGLNQLQWALQRWDGKGLNCPEAWGYDQVSNGIRVAVLDQGIWWANPEFGGDGTLTYGGANVVKTGQDWVPGSADTSNGRPYEESEQGHCCGNGHGTAMAGLIAAKTNDGGGMAGICWGNVELAAMRVCHNEYDEGSGECSDEWPDRWWEVFDVLGDRQLHAAHVASGSFWSNTMQSCGPPFGRLIAWPYMETSLRRTTRKAFTEDSVAMFFAAGNRETAALDCTSKFANFPAAFLWTEAITTTGAAGCHMQNFYHGNCGQDPLAQPYGWIDLAAPPGWNEIPAPHFERCSQFWDECWSEEDTVNALNYRMGMSSLTSAATALAAGVGAMVIDAYMDSAREDRPGGIGSRPIPEDVYGIMERSAQPCSEDQNIENPSQPNHHVGWGRIDAGLAVYDALYADIQHHVVNGFHGWEPVGLYSWQCPAGDDCNFPSRTIVATAFKATLVVNLTTLDGVRTGCWGHHRSPTLGTIPLLIDGLEADDVLDGLDYRWCDPTSYDRSATACTLQTYVYHLSHPDAVYAAKTACPYEDVFVPCPLGSVVFSYSTLSSDRYLSTEDDDSSRFSSHQPRPVLEVFPQPSNPELSIRFVIPVEGYTSMRVYNVNGQLVRTLVSGPMQPGLYFTHWDG